MSQTFDHAYPGSGSSRAPDLATVRPHAPAATASALSLLATSLQNRVAPLLAPGRRRVFLVDADALERSAADAQFRGALCRADMLLPDDPARSACGGLESPPSGTALMPLLLAQAALQGKSVFLLGGAAGAAEAAAMGMMRQAPGLRIAGALGGRIAGVAPEAACDRINASGAAILLVSMRSPKQEAWIDWHGHRIDAALQMAVGSVFDDYVQNVLHSPRLLSV